MGCVTVTENQCFSQYLVSLERAIKFWFVCLFFKEHGCLSGSGCTAAICICLILLSWGE